MENRVIALGLTGLVVVLIGIAFFAPWWTVSLSGSSFGVSSSDSASAKPFDTGGTENNTLIEDGEAVLAGILLLLGLLATVGALVLGLMAHAEGGQARLGPWLLLGAAAVLILAPILAVTTWPADEQEFWDSQSSSGFTVTIRADFGWYLSLVAAAACVSAALMGLMARPTRTPTIQYAQRVR